MNMPENKSSLRRLRLFDAMSNIVMIYIGEYKYMIYFVYISKVSSYDNRRYLDIYFLIVKKGNALFFIMVQDEIYKLSHQCP